MWRNGFQVGGDRLPVGGRQMSDVFLYVDHGAADGIEIRSEAALEIIGDVLLRPLADAAFALRYVRHMALALDGDGAGKPAVVQGSAEERARRMAFAAMARPLDQILPRPRFLGRVGRQFDDRPVRQIE